MDMDRQEFKTLETELLEAGYEQRASSGAEWMDRPMVEGETCDDCGGEVKYHPFTKPGRMESYRAFGVCQKCGGAYEF